jgi:hypothetical protein
LRSDGVLAWIDPTKAASGQNGWLEEITAPAGTKFVDVTSAQEAVLALDSAGGTWTRGAGKPGSGRYLGTGVASKPKGGLANVGVGAMRYDGLVLRSDGSVVKLRSGDVTHERRDPGTRYVRLAQGTKYPVALTAGGGVVSLLWDWYLDGEATRVSVVPPLEPGWVFVDAATTTYAGVFAVRRVKNKAAKRLSVMHEPDLSQYRNQCVAQSGTKRKGLRMEVVTRGNPKGGIVVVKRLGKVLGKAKVTSWTGAVSIPLNTAGLKVNPSGGKAIKVMVSFQGTKTTKRSKPTKVQVHVETRPSGCSR